MGVQGIGYSVERLVMTLHGAKWVPVETILREYASTDSGSRCGCWLWHECGEDTPRNESLQETLAWKREDSHYPRVVASLKEKGWTKAIKVLPDTNLIRDGNHRLAAAIDLGMTEVPIAEDYYPESDSGCW